MSASHQRTASQLLALLLSALWPFSGAAQGDAEGPPQYAIEYRVLVGDGTTAQVSLEVTQQTRTLRRLRIPDPGPEFTDFHDDGGNLTRDGDDWVWTVDANGGQLSWTASLDRRRANGSVDAMKTDAWMLLRIEDLVPPIASATRPGAESDAQMVFELPEGWSIVTPYPRVAGGFPIEDSDRRMDHPDGWIVAGDIGVRYDRIANTTVAIAAPREQAARRLDVMAFLNWHLSHVRNVMPGFPERLLVAMADDPFFRGGLSAPNSLFLHSDRPLVSGNGTSTLLHELIHVGLGRSAGPDADWIVEGIAEYYSLTLLYRAGSVTRRRHRNTLRDLREWGQDVTSLRTDASSGPVTARAATVLSALDAEIRRRSGGSYSLDDAVRALAAEEGPLTLDALREAVRTLLGRDADAIADANLPGYG
ncbi:MAG: hypothetical protein AAFX75_11550 [Pseudomonadota bacterium]